MSITRLQGPAQPVYLIDAIELDASGLSVVVTPAASLLVVGGGVEATALRVTLASDSTGVLSIDDNGGSITIDAAALPLPTGAATAAAQALLLTELQGKADTAEAQVITLSGEAVVLGAGTAAFGKLSANDGVDIGNVDVASIAAGETHIGAVGASDTVVTITCSLPTGALTTGDVMFDTQEIALAARTSGGVLILQSVTVLDKDDQALPFDLVFLDTNTSIGTEDSPVSISDANAEDIVGIVSIVASDYVDLIGSQFATKSGIGHEMKAEASTSIWVAGITRGTPTYTASGVLIKFSFLRS